MSIYPLAIVSMGAVILFIAAGWQVFFIRPTRKRYQANDRWGPALDNPGLFNLVKDQSNVSKVVFVGAAFELVGAVWQVALSAS